MLQSVVTQRCQTYHATLNPASIYVEPMQGEVVYSGLMPVVIIPPPTRKMVGEAELGFMYVDQSYQALNLTFTARPHNMSPRRTLRYSARAP